MKLKIRSRVKFFAALFAGIGTAVRKDGLAAYVDLDYSLLNLATSFNSSDSIVAIYHPSTGIWEKTSLASILSGSQTYQIITAGSTVNVAATDGLIIINKTSGSATAVNMPASALKIGKCKIVDWKGDAGTNNITINNNASEKFNANQSTWTLAADGASIVLDPIPTGIGYAV